MEELRILARETFSRFSHKFHARDQGVSYYVLNIDAPLGHQPGQLVQTRMAGNNLISCIAEARSISNPEDGTTACAVLRLIHVPCDPRGVICMPQDLVSDLLSEMRADNHILYLLCHDYDGFHYFNGPGPCPEDDDRLIAYVGTSEFSLVWTSQSHQVSTCTTALLFHRRNNDQFAGFQAILQAYEEHVHSPHLLAFVSALHMLREFDEETRDREFARIRAIEDSTGYGPDPPESVERFTVATLTRWSQTVGEIQANIRNKMRHHSVSGTLLDFVDREYNLMLRNTKHKIYPRPRESTKRLVEAIPVLKRQMDAYEGYLQYLGGRAEKLSPVLVALLSHEDAEINLNISRAMKDDSTSMKTVAIMTMAFLPATFFAALFTVPSLQWGDTPVIQTNFWVYWAFTLPTTVAVFLVWCRATSTCQWYVHWPPKRLIRFRDSEKWIWSFLDK